MAEKREQQVPWFVVSMAGGASGVVTRALTQPLDVVKIRLQVQDTKKSSRKYKGTWQSMWKIGAEEGIGSLWKGHAPAQVLSLLYGLVQFSGFDFLSRLSHPFFSASSFYQPFQDFLCGSLAGVVATFISYPFDVVRTRYIIQAAPPVYRSMRQTFSIIIRKESMRGLYRGFMPTVVQIAPNTGFQFAFYHLSCKLWDWTSLKLQKDFGRTGHKAAEPSTLPSTSSHTTHPSLAKSLLCGSLAGFGGKSIVYPLDFLKKRLQAEGTHLYSSTVVGRRHNYTGTFQCLLSVVRHEGVGALYNGFVPSSIKAVSTSALIFASFEHFRQVFSRIHTSYS